MLKYVKVKNSLSFKEETEINFESSFRWKKDKKDNVFRVWDSVLMKNMLIYWANASWKSNIIKIVSFIKSFTLFSSEKNFFSKNKQKSFLLNIDKKDEPSFFEIWFFIKDNEYKYNFEILNNRILAENLFQIKKVNRELKDIMIFNRNGLNIIAGESFETELEKWKAKVREDSSVISVLSQWNWKLNWENIDYFFNKISFESDWSMYKWGYTQILKVL